MDLMDTMNNSAQNTEHIFTTNFENFAMLVDFGDSEANNVYELVDWNTVIKDSYTNYRAIGYNLNCRS
ncbi:MAG: hypothetical protein DRP06_02600 [Candidatus Aenigmatarchaeota archaeon]|nr:MAG: hypothetical protein DRP06_02600 [Candidatus Aenigmarchaeota archaeon]